MSIEEILEHEARSVGRKVRYVNGAQFNGDPSVTFVIYDCEPFNAFGYVSYDRRYTVYVGDKQSFSGIVSSFFEDEQKKLPESAAG
jgi:hypothetical protein